MSARRKLVPQPHARLCQLGLHTVKGAREAAIAVLEAPCFPGPLSTLSRNTCRLELVPSTTHLLQHSTQGPAPTSVGCLLKGVAIATGDTSQSNRKQAQPENSQNAVFRPYPQAEVLSTDTEPPSPEPWTLGRSISRDGHSLGSLCPWFS